MKALYIDPSGIIRYNEFPEEPKRDCNSNACDHPGRQDGSCQCENYEMKLKSAKYSAVECQKLEHPKRDDYEFNYLYERAVAEYSSLLRIFLCSEKDTIHPFPEGYKVEVKWVPTEMKPPNDAGKRYRDYGDRAFITPLKEHSITHINPPKI